MSTIHQMTFSQSTLSSNCIQYTHGDSQCNGLMCHLFSIDSAGTNLDASNDECDQDDDVIVDLNSGSLDPVSLKSWTLMTEMTEQFTRL